jgi:hypothetical protein
VFGDLTLAWKTGLRFAVAYVLTALAIDWLPPIRWRTAVLIAALAMAAEGGDEIPLGTFLGPRAGVAIQLATSALAYALVLGLSIGILQRRQPAAFTFEP